MRFFLREDIRIYMYNTFIVIVLLDVGLPCAFFGCLRRKKENVLFYILK